MRRARLGSTLVVLCVLGRAAAGDVIEKVTVVPGELSVSVHASVVDDKKPAWVYVSDGLRARGQKEVVIAVKREAGEGDKDYPRDLLSLYRSFHDLAGSGRTVDAGGITMLGPTAKLLGRADYRCLVYIGPEPFAGVVAPVPSIIGLVVTCNEAQSAQRFGHTRLMGRLGKEDRQFPTVTWADRKRSERVAADGDKGSILDRMGVMNVPRAWIRKERSNKVVLAISEEAAAKMRTHLSEIPARTPFALLLSPDPTADAILVWRPGQSATEAISPAGSSGARVSGNFIAFAPGVDKDAVALVEDGFVVALTAASWAKVRAALESATPLSLPIGDSFEIARAEDMPIAVPSHPAPLPAGPIKPEGIVLVTPEAELAARVEIGDLAEYLKRVEAEVVAEGRATPVTGGIDLRVALEIDPKTGASVNLGFRPKTPLPFADRLQARLEKLSPPTVKTSAISIMVLYRINGGTGEKLAP